jgi:SAM-dependent methyltransferase
MMEFWDQRYDVEEYVYGKEPNAFFKDQLDALHPGKILLPGEGEGRNAVYAAKRGWEVTAFDVSIEGKKKALRLASEVEVSIQYDLFSYLEYSNQGKLFDVIGLFFTHQPHDLRSEFHRNLQEMLNPGGLIIMEAFHKKQIHRDSGGPQNIDYLFDEQELLSDFSQLEILKLEVLTRKLDEGIFHQGEAEVIQFLGQK